jgi:murein DD-endopeptidase MepM/ murein hydrolase activator NlpD
MSLRILLVVCLHALAQGNALQAQSVFPKRNYPTHYFINPVDTAFSIVGNFGECRPNHFHSGIDIRTNGEENHRVMAAADGYVSRIKIEPGGFGNALYITHPNGYTSVYAHLNRFRNDLEKLVRDEQYQTRSWRQDIILKPNQFPVQQSDFIALSGNTGSSQGPHVHFEIRHTLTEAPLNGLLFFPQYADTIAPRLYQLATYRGDKSIYQQSPVIYNLKANINGAYKLPNDTINVNTDFYLGFRADDFSQVATGTLGVYEMQLYVDNQLYFAWQLDSISYTVTRYMNAHADYPTRKQSKGWFQLAHRLPNDRLPIYLNASGNQGRINILPGQYRNIRLVCFDAAMNKSTLQFVAHGYSPTNNKTTCVNAFKAGQANRLENAWMRVELNDQALYDDVCFRSSISLNQQSKEYRFRVHDAGLPLHTSMRLYLKPRKPIPDSLSQYICVVRIDGRQRHGQLANWANNRVEAIVKEAGDYEIAVDKTPPRIASTIKNGDRINEREPLSFVITDETTSVKKAEAYVDGQWLRLVQQGNRFYYELDTYFPPGKHTLRITAADENNNMASQNFILER